MRANNVYDISSPPEDPMRSVTPRSTGGLTDTPVSGKRQSMVSLQIYLFTTLIPMRYSNMHRSLRPMQQ